jgi:hypothetical protein
MMAVREGSVLETHSTNLHLMFFALITADLLCMQRCGHQGMEQFGNISQKKKQRSIIERRKEQEDTAIELKKEVDNCYPKPHLLQPNLSKPQSFSTSKP